MVIIGFIYTVAVIGILELFASGRLVIPEGYLMIALIWVAACLFVVVMFSGRKQR